MEVAPGQVYRTWMYDGRFPGPEIRVAEGERLRLSLENRLPEGTTIHWHGIPVPNEMDGVPGLTQEPIAPGETFEYEFDAAPGGTYMYHSHVGLQIDRGLIAPLIIQLLVAIAGRDPVEHDLAILDLLGYGWRDLLDLNARDLFAEPGAWDLLVEYAGRRVAFMYRDEMEEHEMPLRDASLIGAGEIDVLYRLRAGDLQKRLHDCLLCIARWEPGLFSTRGHIHLEGLASREAWATPPLQDNIRYRLVYERPAEEDVYEGETFEWEAVVTGDLVVRRYSRDRPDSWMDAYDAALARDGARDYYARAC